MWYIKLAHTNLFPNWLLRLIIRFALNASLAMEQHKLFEEQESIRLALIDKLKGSPIAVQTEVPNLQHYEVPSDFFQLVLGQRLKYSCCYWPPDVASLNEAEDAMLSLTCERAGILDGMQILDLGCGWGSFSIWVAQQYPHARITAFSNSRTQKQFIDAQCARLGITNIQTITADVADKSLPGQYDRVVSIEMFEHMRNYQHLLGKIASALKPEGKLFVHIFSNTHRASEFNAVDPNAWMARTFFTGGLMPSDDLLLHFQDDLALENHWRLSGIHYEQTLNAWFKNLINNKTAVLPILEQTYGHAHRRIWWVNWKLFFLGCSETWRLNRGNEYIVSHYLFSKRNE